MDNNNSTTTTWNPDQTNVLLQAQDHHHQIPMDSGIWPNYHLLQMPSSSSTINIATPSSSSSGISLSDILGIHMEEELEEEELGAMKEMMYKIAAMQPVDIDPASIRKPKRRNVRISDDPQSVAARHRRERISEKMRILQRLVPGGTKMDTASMLDEAILYVKFLKRQIRLLQSTPPTSIPLLAPSCDWPFAPNVLPNSVDIPAGVGFAAGGHGQDQPCDASSTL